jgi:hypothetical protein
MQSAGPPAALKIILWPWPHWNNNQDIPYEQLHLLLCGSLLLTHKAQHSTSKDGTCVQLPEGHATVHYSVHTCTCTYIPTYVLCYGVVCKVAPSMAVLKLWPLKSVCLTIPQFAHIHI